MRQLDGLRCFAVLAVLVWHAWGPGPLPWIGYMDWGGLGVQLFFVLSGFLITGILLDCRERADAGDGTRMSFVRRFYARRFLRIFPLYYGVLLVLLIVNFPHVRERSLWLFTYTSNIFMAEHGWIPRVGHFWTLAVEEQFYLVWPWLLLFLPRRRLLPLIALVIALAPLYRLYAFHRYGLHGVAQEPRTTFTLAAVDSLGIGALLAIGRRAVSVEKLRSRLTRIALPIGLGGYLGLAVLQEHGVSPEPAFVLGATTIAIVFGWLVLGAADGFTGPFGRLLVFRPVVYVGRISYGIYVFHPFVIFATVRAARHLGVDFHARGALSFVVITTMTIGVAALSWHFFEGPINGLKGRFSYRDRQSQADHALSVRAAGH
jgi:peptidoglycan/LPS O-acetylase OafA/YrhL